MNNYNDDEIEQGKTGIGWVDDNVMRGNIVDDTIYTKDNMTVTAVLGDVLYVTPIDETEDGYIKSPGGLLDIPVNKKEMEYFRFVKVLLRGPKVDESIKIGDILIVPQISLAGTVGIKTKDGKFAFISEHRVMGIVTFENK